MARLSDTKIHQTELLITLDYLLNNTDEFHPATQIDICEYARKYGLKFDKNEKTGNQIRRQRVGECLKFLKEITNSFTDDVPFVLEQTESGKYYVEQRHALNENQVAKILAAICNDKYTKDEDVNFLINRVLSAFSTSEENRKLIDNEFKTLTRGVKKFDKETIRKINLIEKAYREGKMIKIKFSVTNPKTNKMFDYFFWYRVYFIKEFHNQLHAFLLPIGQLNIENGELQFIENYIFSPIESINIANGPERDILCEDFDENRDFNKLFREKCGDLSKQYNNLDDFLERQLLPKGGKASIVSFYFNLTLKDILKRSYESFFSEEFRYQETNIISGFEKTIKDLNENFDNWLIVTDDENNEPKYGLVNICVNNKAFKSWLLSDPHGEGWVCIFDMITIIKPYALNEEIINYFYSKLLRHYQFLKYNEKKDLARKINKELNIKSNN